ncbi:transglutaminase-like domain-containing protein [Halomonas sp. M5N1S17]|uniref:transglutaminase-like domain-containing protein n=1 Tax=Halomonas alkalisoli TaxID=2907158 RepID=UPI001F15A868|nr:transglutaminase-like domain-containing protein [Halomonas alkalisoli]MCE9664011.1 transglutaminase-like domain-containing protein [Halomonas alkalisoli]
MKMKIKLVGMLVVLPMLFFTYLFITQVDNGVTREDKLAIGQVLGPFFEGSNDGNLTFQEEVDFIRLVQGAVLGNVPVNSGIPHGMPREPNDLLARGKGLCFDRSRFIEKALRQHGFETRHIAIYSTVETGSAIKSLLTPQVRSHAVTEVLTSKGWMVVDSNEPWISLDNGYRPLSIDHLSALGGSGMVERLMSQPETSIYAGDFTFVYGLYSRHGMFYPPYDRIPDINIAELSQNISRIFN